MRRRVAAIALIAMVAGLAGGPQAGAQTDGDGGSATVTATVLGGTRAVTTATAIGLTTTAGTVGDAQTLTGTYSVVVTETLRTGTNPWSLTGALSDLSDGATTPNVIPKSAGTISGRGVTVVYTLGSPAGTSDAAAINGSATLDAARTVFEIDGESPAVSYTGTFTGAGTISVAVPQGQASGAYTGTFTYTLVQ